jgi:hypothetical protein
MIAVLRRALQGQAQWGTLTIQPDRFGTRYLLVVYPPGSTDAERRRIRIWRGWPLWGALLWVLSEMTLIRHIDPWLALVVSTGLLTVCAVAAFAAAGAPRGRVRVLAATLLPRRYDPVSKDLCDTMTELAQTLRDADTLRATGAISAARFELTWWTVYDAMGAVRPGSPQR